MTLEDYFRYEYADGKIDFSLRVHVSPQSKCGHTPPRWYCTRDADHEGPCAAYPAYVEFYIHPSGRNGTTTPSLVVNGNTVSMKPGSWAPGWSSNV